MADSSNASPGRSTGRLEAFSDGVFAIAITVLVLGLSLPDGWQADPVAAVTSQWPTYLAYVVSFATIGAIWLAHTAITDSLHSGSLHFARLNLLLLMLVSFLTFPTALVGEAIASETAERVATTTFGVNLLGIAVVTSLLWRHARTNGLLHPDLTDDEIQVLTRRLTPSLAGYALLILVAVVLPIVAVAGYLAIALVLLLPRSRPTPAAPDR